MNLSPASSPVWSRRAFDTRVSFRPGNEAWLMGRVLIVDIIIQPFVEDTTDEDLDGRVSSSVEWRLFVL